ncbi:hypothetical protein [Hyphomicrobium sp. CS1BSMeth3]|uniref:tetratricopeptide repeat protein n=1 Tax=Hyphomicrobium sp. CS1BSMeth3 TaxID=1892844 RepID=UPI000931DF13|nr:hypothetical protein [Hyphomicrobium sp. CS1BSMeth3]
MEFFDLYGQYIGPLLLSLSKIQINVTAIQLIQIGLASIGACVSIFGAYKAWRYAEKRLGRRLDEFLDHEEEKLLQAREAIRAIRDKRNTPVSGRPKIFTNGELVTVLKLIGGQRYGAAKDALHETLARTHERAELARRKEDLHSHQRAMAHLLLGAIADAENDHQTALIHFQSALDIDEDDVEALEYVGLQFLKLGNARQALVVFSQLEAKARARGTHLLVAQALRNCGLAYEALPNPQYQNANNCYKAAIDEFPKSGAALELAHLHELRGFVNVKRSRPRRAYDSLTHALTTYSALEHQGGEHSVKAREGVARVLPAVQELQLLLNGTNDGDVDNDDFTVDASADRAATSPLTEQQHIPNQPSNGISPN